MHDVETDWKCLASGDVDLKELLLKRSYTPINHLATVRSRVGMADYLLHDPKPLLCHRARLRFDLARLNASLHRRCSVASPHCPECAGVPETPAHVMLVCPRFEAHRSRMRSHLVSLGAKMTLPIILGETTTIQSLSRAAALSATGTFISVVQAIRRF